MMPMRANIVEPRCHLDHCRLPLRGDVLGFRKLGDVFAGISEGDELAPFAQWDRIIEIPRPIRRHGVIVEPWLPGNARRARCFRAIRVSGLDCSDYSDGL